MKRIVEELVEAMDAHEASLKLITGEIRKEASFEFFSDNENWTLAEGTYEVCPWEDHKFSDIWEVLLDLHYQTLLGEKA